MDAIVNATEISEAQRPFIALNAQFARDKAWRPLTRSKPALADHAHWGAVVDKRHLIEMP